MTKLFLIQQELVAPKDKYNEFGKYAYRSAEGILEALKPLLKTHSCTLNLRDEVRQVGEWVFIEAIVTLTDDETGQLWMSSASARHADSQKGMQEAQITGSASSYARKYALSGLFAIDDEKDDDTRPPKEEAGKEPASGLVKTCAIHNVKMPERTSKAGNAYWAHKLPDGSICFGN